MQAKLVLRPTVLFLLLVLGMATPSSSQIQTVVPGIITSVVQYDTGSSTKFYQISNIHSIGKDSAAYGGLHSRNDTWRTGIAFSLIYSGITRGSTIQSVSLIITIGGSTYNAKVTALDSMQNMLDAGNLWQSAGTGATVFNNVPYGSNARELSSTDFKTRVQNHVYYGKINLGVVSLNEGTNGTGATVSTPYLTITYTPPPGKVTVKNSLQGGM